MALVKSLSLIALLAPLALVACSTSDAHPPTLGDCTGPGCSGYVGDSGTKPPPKTDGGETDAAADSGADGSALVDGG